LEERKLGVNTVVSHIAALRFFYVKTLRRLAMKEDLPYPNRQRLRLPTILTPEEVSKLIDSARTYFITPCC
jgi:site-specific recombinase XerD